MKRKVSIDIYSCQTCPNCVLMGYYTGKCKSTNKNMLYNAEIPEWCPKLENEMLEENIEWWNSEEVKDKE